MTVRASAPVKVQASVRASAPVMDLASVSKMDGVNDEDDVGDAGHDDTSSGDYA